jgi:transposase InsO family protein
MDAPEAGSPANVLSHSGSDGLLDGEIFTTIRESKALIEYWRKGYNQMRPHSALGHRPPAYDSLIPTLILVP